MHPAGGWKSNAELHLAPWTYDPSNKNTSLNKYIRYWDQLAHRWNWQIRYVRIRRSMLITMHSFCILVLNKMYSTSQGLCLCFARCCILLQFVLVELTHIFKVDRSYPDSVIRLLQSQWWVGVNISYGSKNYKLTKKEAPQNCVHISWDKLRWNRPYTNSKSHMRQLRFWVPNHYNLGIKY